MLEFNRLVERGVFTIIPVSEAKHNRIFGAQFVNSAKYKGKSSVLEKYRLVVQAYNNKKHGYLTYSSYSTTRLPAPTLGNCAMDSDLWSFTQEGSQAYVQCKPCTQHPIFVRLPEALNILSHVLL